MNRISPVYRSLFLAFLALTLATLPGCGKNYEQQVADNDRQVQSRLGTLRDDLDAGRVRNASIVSTYANKLGNTDPDLREIASTLKKEATPDGLSYQNLVRRLSAVNRTPKNEAEYAAAIGELNNLWIASDPVVFNDGLMDVVNSLADLSGGQLPRINIPRQSDDNPSALAGQTVPGSYLVGNPAYGQWKSDSSGQSFWEWYGKFALLQNVVGALGGGFSRGPIDYGGWHRRPRYSYYDDFGRSSYGSSKDRSAWKSGKERLAAQGIRTAPPKDYSSLASKRRVSAYSTLRKKSSRPSGLASGTKHASTYASYAGSSRGTSLRSRSAFRGK